ncbi:MAG: response regulator [Cyanobacteriota bacterium]|nr:response regulator [Cyanobacteriota bacterium]
MSPAGNTMAPLVAVVDDDPRIRSLLQLELEDEGIEPLIFSSPLELLNAPQLAGVQLVLLDLMMPEMDGLSCLRRLRRDGFRGRVVIVSAMCDPGQRQELMAAGATAFVLKTNLFEALGELLSGL